MQSARGEIMKFYNSHTHTVQQFFSFVKTYCRNIGNGSTCPSIFKTNSASASGLLEASLNGLQQNHSHNTSFAGTYAVVVT